MGYPVHLSQLYLDDQTKTMNLNLPPCNFRDVNCLADIVDELEPRLDDLATDS